MMLCGMLRHALAAALLAGCSSPSSGGSGIPPGAMCSPPNGAYRMHFDRIDGTCNTPPDTIVVLPGTAGDNCVDMSMDAPDHCSGVVDETCPGTDANGNPISVNTQGKVQVNDVAGNSAVATATITVRSSAGATLCDGTFRISYVKL